MLESRRRFVKYRPMARPLAKAICGFGIGVLVLIVILLALTLRAPPALPPLPNPNGYDALVKASGLLAEEPADSDKLDIEGLRRLVATNAGALKLAREALSNDCRVSWVRVRFEEPRVPIAPGVEAGQPGFLTNLSGLKRLARAMAMEGRLAELEGRPQDAARSYATVIRIGSETSRGGVIISALVSVAIEAIGSTYLEKLVRSLDAQAARECATALETADARRESVAATLQAEKHWARLNYGLRGQISRILEWRSIQQMEQKALSRMTTQQVRTRRLTLDLAARAFELEKGERPKSASDLVPAYLKAVPLDPVTGTNMLYRP